MASSTPMMDFKESIDRELERDMKTCCRRFNSVSENNTGFIDNGVLQKLIEECKKPQVINNYNYTMNFYVSIKSEEDVSRFEKMLSITTSRLGLK